MTNDKIANEEAHNFKGGTQYVQFYGDGVTEATSSARPVERRPLCPRAQRLAEQWPHLPRVYVAGPMTGIKDFNFPAFNDVAARLRGVGFPVENPAEISHPSEDWLQCMRGAVARLVTCDAVVLLDGWAKSKGARIEYRLAISLGLEVVEWSTFGLFYGAPLGEPYFKDPKGAKAEVPR